MSGNYDKIVKLYHTYKDDEIFLKVFYANDYPLPYKSLTLYPVQVDMYYFFEIFSQCLLLPHLTSGDMKAVSMSYLKYLCYLGKDKGKPEYLTCLIELLKMVLRIDDNYTDSSGIQKASIDINIDKGLLIVKGDIFDGKDFDKIRAIILEQNGVEIPDETLSPKLVKAYNENKEFEQRHSGVKMCSFEDQINIVVAMTGYKRDEVLQMTLRSFSRLFARIDKILNYKIFSLLSPYIDKKGKKNKIVGHYAENIDTTLKERIEQEMISDDAYKKKWGQK